MPAKEFVSTNFGNDKEFENAISEFYDREDIIIRYIFYAVTDYTESQTSLGRCALILYDLYDNISIDEDDLPF